MSDDTFTSCTGPYTRIPLSSPDLKPVQILLEGLAAANAIITVRARPSGNGGTDDFELHVDLRDPKAADTVWDVRAAKFLGPKRFLGRGHIYEIAVRKRNADNAVVWEGYKFDAKLKTLAGRFPHDWQGLVDGEPTDDWLPADRAQVERIRLCTGG